MSEQSGLREWIISIAQHNAPFRERLLSHPKETLERELGLTFPAEVNLSVREETQTSIYIVLPAQGTGDENQDVSIADLEAVTPDPPQPYCPRGEEDHPLQRIFGL